MVQIPPQPELHLSDDAFEEIYLSIKQHLKKGADKKALHLELARIIIFTAPIAHEKEFGPSHGENTKLINRLHNNVETLLETLMKVEEFYPSVIDPTNGTKYSQTPDWLKPYTDQFDIDNLRSMQNGLEELHEHALDFSDYGKKKPRYSGRIYYIKKLIEVFEAFTGQKAKARENDSTPFSDFVLAFFYHAPIEVKDRKEITGYVVYEEMKKN